MKRAYGDLIKSYKIMRKKYEILEDLHSNIKFLRRGLCGLAGQLLAKHIYSIEEYVWVKAYIKQHKPFMFSSLDIFLSRILGDYYWTPGLKEPRITWLKKHMKILKRDEKAKLNP